MKLYSHMLKQQTVKYFAICHQEIQKFLQGTAISLLRFTAWASLRIHYFSTIESMFTKPGCLYFPLSPTAKDSKFNNTAR